MELQQKEQLLANREAALEEYIRLRHVASSDTVVDLALLTSAQQLLQRPLKCADIVHDMPDFYVRKRKPRNHQKKLDDDTIDSTCVNVPDTMTMTTTATQGGIAELRGNCGYIHHHRHQQQQHRSHHNHKTANAHNMMPPSWSSSPLTSSNELNTTIYNSTSQSHDSIRNDTVTSQKTSDQKIAAVNSIHHHPTSYLSGNHHRTTFCTTCQKPLNVISPSKKKNNKRNSSSTTGTSLEQLQQAYVSQLLQQQ
jgi:hypothetical protein